MRVHKTIQIKHLSKMPKTHTRVKSIFISSGSDNIGAHIEIVKLDPYL